MNKIILDDIEKAKKLFPRVLGEFQKYQCCNNSKNKMLRKLGIITGKDTNIIEDYIAGWGWELGDIENLSFQIALPEPKIIENISQEELNEICEIVKREKYRTYDEQMSRYIKNMLKSKYLDGYFERNFYMHYNDYFEKLLEINLRYLSRNPENELNPDCLNYAVRVIASRSLPDVRDGLKLVQRRLLYTMDDYFGLSSESKKSAYIVFETMRKYHPHDALSLYRALVYMTQDFSLRYPLINGQGNFGNIYGDSSSAMNFTEAQISHIGNEMLWEIRKETVDFVANCFSPLAGGYKEPIVLPSAFPNLLVNGSSGIAAGMETNMAPHNLVEICDAICAYIDNPDISINELMHLVQGPDFPTGGVIIGNRGIREAYETGRGKLQLRGKFTIEAAKHGKEKNVFYEIPYNTDMFLLLEKIDLLVHDKIIDGISNVKDESDRKNLRIVINLKKGTVINDVLNQLFSNTQLQTSFDIINLALVDGKPQCLNLKELIHHFVEHRVEVVTRRTNYDLRKAEERTHVLEGLTIVLTNIDEAFAIIKASRDGTAANQKLQEHFPLSQAQFEAIAEMRLISVTKLEIEKLQQELEEFKGRIAHYKSLLADEKKLRGIIKDETKAIAEKYGDARRTEIVDDEVEYFSHSIAI